MSDTVRRIAHKYGRHPRLIFRACDGSDKTGELCISDDDGAYQPTVRETSLNGRNRDANSHHMWGYVPHAASRELWNFGRGLKLGPYRKIKKSWQAYATNLWFLARKKVPYFYAVHHHYRENEISEVWYLSRKSCYTLEECAGMAE